MVTAEIKQLIKRELPVIFREDAEIHRFIMELTSAQFADKRETESRFDRTLDELRRDREEYRKQWVEHLQEEKQWRAEHLQEEKQWRAEYQEKDKQHWDEHREEHRAILQEIHALARKHDSTLGALGARWGLNAEESFRQALKSILGESFGVQVLNITEFDETGEVFGEPDQVELDIIIKNGLLIICEIKASMSRGDVSVFSRKCKFYERLHRCTADRRLIISPMVRDDARRIAAKLGLEVFSYAEEVQP